MSWKLGLAGLSVLGACGGITQPLGDVTGGAAGSAGKGITAGAGGMVVGAGAPSSVSSAPSNSCEVPCVRQIFQANITMCKLCHNAGPNSGGLVASGLDLATDGFSARLKDVPALHTDLGQGMSLQDCPVGDKLIDSATPDNSWLLMKIRGLQGNCGTIMPSAGTLDAEQRACLETYVYCVAAQ